MICLLWPNSMKVNVNYYIIEFQPYSWRLNSVFIPGKITETEPPTLNVIGVKSILCGQQIYDPKWIELNINF